jgi:DNA polymerase-1
MQKLVLLDGHAIIHRAFHAIRPLTTSQGEPVNAVFGFGSMLLNVLEIEKPEYLAATFDEKGPTKRAELDDTYKANRVAAPDELISQFGRCRELCAAFNIPIFSQSGYEADDLIGTIAEEMKAEPGVHTIIVSGDRDLLQLVDEKTSVHDLTGGYRQSVNFTPEKVREKYGFAPEFVPDFKGLAGDASDNITGISGIGPVAATKLIQKYGHLEEMWRRREELEPAGLREKLTAGYETALHCRQMATVHRDVAIDWRLPNCRLHDFEAETVLQFFDQLEMKNLKARTQKMFPEQFHAAANPATSGQQSLF